VVDRKLWLALCLVFQKLTCALETFHLNDFQDVSILANSYELHFPNNNYDSLEYVRTYSLALMKAR
jgi:hypothetical protein